MNISITLPDEVAHQMERQWLDLPRCALEALTAQAYRRGVITSAQVRRILDLPTRLEVDAFLKSAGAYLDYSEEDLDRDIRELRRSRGG